MESVPTGSDNLRTSVLVEAALWSHGRARDATPALSAGCWAVLYRISLTLVSEGYRRRHFDLGELADGAGTSRRSVWRILSRLVEIDAIDYTPVQGKAPLIGLPEPSFTADSTRDNSARGSREGRAMSEAGSRDNSARGSREGRAMSSDGSPGRSRAQQRAKSPERNKEEDLDLKDQDLKPWHEGEPRAERQRDELWDALVEALGYAPTEITKAQRGALNGALGQLREVGATPDEIRRRARIFRQVQAWKTLTPSALAKDWPALRNEPDLAKAAPPSNGNGHRPYRDPEDLSVYDGPIR